nr:5-(carboxyamino)imidazole ribonucleotide synthase [Nitrospirota bacterium]
MSGRVEPGEMIGVLGGGQLGAMFAVAARRLGYRVAVWDPDADAPALKVADLPLHAPFTDSTTLATFAGSISAATYEWENIPVATVEALEQRIPVRPAGRVLRVLQHRLEQKQYLARHGIPVAPFKPLAVSGDLRAAAEALGFPCLCKTATQGYDGKGQWRLAGAQEVASVQTQLSQQAHSPWVLEQFLVFEKELSVLVVRAADGDLRIYPTVENVHEAGILRSTRVPAELDPRLVRQAGDLAVLVVKALDGVGVFCVELFVMPGGRLFVNEVAPRPHNSGHYTLDACTVSQFEQQVRAVCGLPLGEVRLLSPAVMVNLIGEDVTRVTTGEGLTQQLWWPGPRPRL